MTTATDDEAFRSRLRELMTARQMSFRQLARATYVSKTYLYNVAMGHKAPTAGLAARLDGALDAGGSLAGLLVSLPIDDEIMELTRRLAMSDLSPKALADLEERSRQLAEDYEHVDPREHLERCREYLRLVTNGHGARATTGQRIRLAHAGGFLALTIADLSRHLGEIGRARSVLAVASRTPVPVDRPAILHAAPDARRLVKA